MTTRLEKDVRFLKVYAFVVTLSGVLFLLAFRPLHVSQSFQEIKARRVLLVDSAGKGRVLLASDYKNDNSAGVYFFNQEGTEAGALAYNGKRHADGKVEAYAILTMDQFKDDEVVRLAYEHVDKRKRYGLAISDKPDSLTAKASIVLRELGAALQAARTLEERQALRRDHLARVPQRELGARRVFVGRDYEGAAIVTLADQDGKPRLRLQVDSAGTPGIQLLDPSGRVVREIKP